MSQYSYVETSSRSILFRSFTLISADIFFEQTKVLSIDNMLRQDVHRIVFLLNTAYELGHTDGEIIGRMIERTMNDIQRVA